MNSKNSNKPFQDFSNCDYNLHWSFSNFNRHLITCNKLNELPLGSMVLELGAGDSPIKEMMRTNYNRTDLAYIRTEHSMAIDDDIDKVIDLSKSKEKTPYLEEYGRYNAVVCCEVIEHVDDNIDKMIMFMSNLLKPEGLLILSTPTPPHNKHYEQLVWPKDHDFEFTRAQVYTSLNKKFKVNLSIGWSLEEREFNRVLENDELAQKVYCKLKSKVSESYIRALMPLLQESDMSRQCTFICKKRRA